METRFCKISFTVILLYKMVQESDCTFKCRFSVPINFHHHIELNFRDAPEI
jgi:hypothetical protein